MCVCARYILQFAKWQLLFDKCYVDKLKTNPNPLHRYSGHNVCLLYNVNACERLNEWKIVAAIQGTTESINKNYQNTYLPVIHTDNKRSCVFQFFNFFFFLRNKLFFTQCKLDLIVSLFASVSILAEQRTKVYLWYGFLVFIVQNNVFYHELNVVNSSHENWLSRQRSM